MNQLRIAKKFARVAQIRIQGPRDGDGMIRAYRNDPDNMVLQIREQNKPTDKLHRYASTYLNLTEAIQLRDSLNEFIAEQSEGVDIVVTLAATP